jgi:hypothetical protein
MPIHVDCLGCGCLIQAAESSCPFCGTSLRHASAPFSRLSIGLTFGLGLGLFACGDKEGDTASDSITDSQDGDSESTTVGDPDETDTMGGSTSSGSTSGESTIGESTISDDPPYTDAVTYAGPDETDWIGLTTGG